MTKKIFVLLIALIGFGICANAGDSGSVNVYKKIYTWAGEEQQYVGTVDYSYEYNYTGWLVVNVYNNTGENINVTIRGKGVTGSCYKSFDMCPWQWGDCWQRGEKTKYVSISCPNEPYNIEVTVTVR